MMHSYGISHEEVSLTGMMKSEMNGGMDDFAFPLSGLLHGGSTGDRARSSTNTTSEIVSIIDSVLDLLGEDQGDNEVVSLPAAPNMLLNHQLQPKTRQ